MGTCGSRDVPAENVHRDSESQEIPTKPAEKVAKDVESPPHNPPDQKPSETVEEKEKAVPASTGNLKMDLCNDIVNDNIDSITDREWSGSYDVWLNYENKSYTPLMLAAMLGKDRIVEFLLSRGATAKVWTSADDSPLTLAIKGGHELAAIHLIAAGSTPEPRKDSKFNPEPAFHHAVRSRMYKVLDTLLEKHCHEPVPKKENAIPSFSVTAEDGEKVDAVADLADDKGNSALYIAVEMSDRIASKALLDHGANANRKNNDGKSPIDICPDSLKDLFGIAVEEKKEEEEEKKEEEEEKKEEEEEKKEDEDEEKRDETPPVEVPQPKVRYRRGGVSAASQQIKDDWKTWKPPVHEKSEELVEIMNGVLDKLFLFNTLDDEEKETLRKAVFAKSAKAGETIIQQGDQGDNFYILHKGEADVLKSFSPGAAPVKVFHYVPKPTCSFGELALMYNMPRAATIVATTECEMLAMDQGTYKNIVLTSNLRKREKYKAFLDKVKIFETLTDSERTSIIDALNPVTYKDGEVIIEQGDTHADTFFILIKGEAKVTKKIPPSEEDVEVLRCHEGDYFGEIALLFDKPRAATVTSVKDVRCLVCDRASFTRLLGPLEEILKRNMDAYKFFHQS